MARVLRRILIPSAGGPGCVNLARSLRLLEPAPYLVGLDADPCYLQLALTDVRLLAPRRDRAEELLAAFDRVAMREKIDFIMPNNSLDGLFLARHRERLPAPVYLPEPAIFEVGEDKWHTWQLLSRAGLPVPATWLLEGPEDLEEPFSRAGGKRPVWVRGAGIPGKGVGVASLPARTVAQAIQWVDYWQGWGKMAASEYLPGANLTWLSVWDHGRLVASQGRMRDAYVIPHVSPSGITGAPAISHTVSRADINELGEQVCRAIDTAFHGPAFVDFKEDEEGRPRVTEINIGRFGTTHNFYSEAGANFPALVTALAGGEPLPAWVKPHDCLPPDLYWIRTLDAGPVLRTRRELEEGERA